MLLCISHFPRHLTIYLHTLKSCLCFSFTSHNRQPIPINIFYVAFNFTQIFGKFVFYKKYQISFIFWTFELSVNNVMIIAIADLFAFANDKIV